MPMITVSNRVVHTYLGGFCNALWVIGGSGGDVFKNDVWAMD